MYVLLCVIGNDKLFTDRFVIPMGEYDVILGMDWLSKYQATVDCFKRRITLVAKDGQVIEYSAKSGIVMPYPLLKACVGGRKNLECLGMIFALDGELGTTSPSLLMCWKISGMFFQMSCQASHLIERSNFALI